MVQTPTPVDFGESLGLIQFKCYQDILKSKSDHRAINVPLSYSKSIQYLGQETNMFLKMNEGNKHSEEKNSNSKQHDQLQQSEQLIQSLYNHKSNDGTMPILKKKDYWSPVDTRVQRLIQRSVQRQRLEQEQQIDDDSGFHKDLVMHKSASEYFNRNDYHKQQLSYQVQKVDQESNTNLGMDSRSQNSKNNITKASNNQTIISSYIKKNSPMNQKKEALLIQERYALKSMDKIKQLDPLRPNQKQFIPLKLNPPFVKRAYAEKSMTFTMGFLKNQVMDFSQQPNVIHANDKLRQKWQNRVGNSQSKQSVVNWEMIETNGWRHKNRSNHTPRYFSMYQGGDNAAVADHENYFPEYQMDEIQDDHSQNLNNFDKLMQYTHYYNRNNFFDKQQSQPQNQEEFGQKQCQADESAFSQQNTTNKSNGSRTFHKTQSQQNFNKQAQVHQLKADGFNHFYKSNLLKKDIETINSQKIRAQLSHQQGFKQQVMLSDAEMIIQNQMPGSKIILKRVHQRNQSQKNEPEINHKVYYTLPDRVNFFKSKQFGVSPNHSQHQNNENHQIIK